MHLHDDLCALGQFNPDALRKEASALPRSPARKCSIQIIQIKVDAGTAETVITGLPVDSIQFVGDALRVLVYKDMVYDLPITGQHVNRAQILRGIEAGWNHETAIDVFAARGSE